MFIVKLITDLTHFDMDYCVTNVVVCNTLKSAIAEAEKVVKESLDSRSEQISSDIHRATEKDFTKWSNNVKDGFEFYSDPMGESLIVEIEEVRYVE